MKDHRFLFNSIIVSGMVSITVICILWLIVWKWNETKEGFKWKKIGHSVSHAASSTANAAKKKSEEAAAKAKQASEAAAKAAEKAAAEAAAEAAAMTKAIDQFSKAFNLFQKDIGKLANYFKS